MDPFGILFAFGAAMVVCGLYYKTPFPVQPMKAIGAVATVQAAQTAVVTPSAIYAAALVTGLIWLALGWSGLAARLGRLVPSTVVGGIILGLGFGFMLEGVRLMQTNWILGGVAGIGALLLMRSRKAPAMFVLLVLGLVVGAHESPDVVAALSNSGIDFRTPDFALLQLSWDDLFVGAVLLALPQVPLTLGNAVLAIKEENNRLFPDRPVTEKGVSLSTGLMNVFSSAVGGVPMCHGAGGMAGHVAFGARTGGAVVILGVLLLTMAFFFSSSVHALLALFPKAVIGVILFLTGVQLALGMVSMGGDRASLFVVLVTAAFCLWNVAIGFCVGILVHHMIRRGLVEP